MSIAMLTVLALLDPPAIVISGLTALYEITIRLRGKESPVPMWLTLAVLGMCVWWFAFYWGNGGMGYFGLLLTENRA